MSWEPWLAKGEDDDDCALINSMIDELRLSFLYLGFDVTVLYNRLLSMILRNHRIPSTELLVRARKGRSSLVSFPCQLLKRKTPHCGYSRYRMTDTTIASNTIRELRPLSYIPLTIH